MKRLKLPNIEEIELTEKQIVRRKQILKDEVKQIKIKSSEDIARLIGSFADMSFESRNIGNAAKLYQKKLEQDTSIIWSLSGSIFSAGLRQIVIDSIRKGYVDALVCTGALFEQDMVEALGHKHYKCNPSQNDSELQELFIDRIYDHVLDEMALRQVDETFKRIAAGIPAGNYSSRFFMNECGRWLSKVEGTEDSVMLAAFENDMPIFIPAINDCSIGIGIALEQNQGGGIAIDSIKDLRELAVMKSKSGDTGIIIIGGGVPKNYSQDSVVMAEMLGLEVEKHSFGIQISTADLRDGGLSGSTLKEAISWGKNSQNLDEVMVWGEATVFFPLLMSYIFHSMENQKRVKRKLNNVFTS